MAYLNGVPDGSKSSRSEVYRLVTKKFPDMPDTNGGEYLIEYMLTIGPGLNGGMGLVPLDFTEILSWSRLSGIELSGWESLAIRNLSRVYVSQLSISNKADCLAPWVRGVKDIEAHNMLKSMKSITEESKCVKTLSNRKNKRGS